MKTTYSWLLPKSTVKVNRKKLKRFIEDAAALAPLPVEKDWILNVVFLDDRKMAEANSEYVGHEGTTDVITFSFLDDTESIFPGDIGLELFVCADVAARVGERRRDSYFEREIALYIVHGILHAAGYDDLCPADRRKMRYHEKRLLTKLAEKHDFYDFFQKK